MKHNNSVGCESMADLGECSAVVLPGRSFSSTVLPADLHVQVPGVPVQHLLLHALRAVHLILLVCSIGRPAAARLLPASHRQVVGLPLA